MPESGADRPASDEQAFRDEIARLNKIVTALMNRAERSASNQRSDFGMFQTTLMLESQVRERTEALEESLHENEKINRALHNAKAQMEIEMEERKRALVALEHEQKEQRILIKKLEDAHHQLLQSEKMASIGQLAAGVAHEINNPIGFVGSNLRTLKDYIAALLELVSVYEQGDSLMADDTALAQRIRELRRAVDIDFLREDAPALINESIEGTERVQRIVQDLRDFSRLENPDWQGADLHAGLEATLNIVSNDVRFKADIVRELGDIPAVECLPFQINQVFLNILLNAAQSITGRGTITLRSGRVTDEVWISITDTGQGIPPERMARIFDPFYTTKPVGQGTGLGLSVSYGIVKKHGGRIDVQSQTGAGTTFTIRISIKRPAAA